MDQAVLYHVDVHTACLVIRYGEHVRLVAISLLGMCGSMVG